MTTQEVIFVKNFVLDDTLNLVEARENFHALMCLLERNGGKASIPELNYILKKEEIEGEVVAVG